MAEYILVIDDEKIILELTSMILRSRGFEVLTSRSAVEGLELIAREQPAVVLLDYMMPVMDGLTALKQIRERFPTTYVIMFTGKGSEEIAVELMKAGASDYILKPFNNQDLVDRISKVFKLRRIELANQELRDEKERLLREIEGWNQELERRVAEKTLELERAQMELLLSEKLSTLGHLSAGLAHEVRNPLNSIGLFAQVLKQSLSSDPESCAHADKILAEVDRIDELLIKLLDASKRSHFSPQPVDLAQLLDRVLDEFSPQLSAQKVQVERNYLADVSVIQADPAEIKQIFTNLLANALYEMPQGGRLGVRMSKDERTVSVAVSDTGKGVPPENLGKIFDPFFTTKVKGTGFGLSLVLRIVRNYGGKITVQNRGEGGTAFHVCLPLEPGADGCQ
ncbi:MAG: sensor histidine kinase [Trichloromonadaceae bacterium]